MDSVNAQRLDERLDRIPGLCQTLLLGAEWTLSILSALMNLTESQLVLFELKTDSVKRLPLVGAQKIGATYVKDSVNSPCSKSSKSRNTFRVYVENPTLAILTQELIFTAPAAGFLPHCTKRSKC